jgi:acetyl esterase/lipase
MNRNLATNQVRPHVEEADGCRLPFADCTMKGRRIDRTPLGTLSMRTRLIRPPFFVWLGLVCLTVWAWRTPPIADRPDWEALGVSLTEGRVYRTSDARELTLDVYRPVPTLNASGADRPRPAVLAIHGGSWNGGSMSAYRYDAQNAAVRLAQHGMVVFAIDYRLARPGSPSWPAVVDDLREAVRWVRRHSREFRVDPDRIAAMGQSSGGLLALLLATCPEEKGPDGVSSRVQAVVTFYAPSDLPGLLRSRHLAHEPARAFLGGSDSGLSGRAAEASPIEHVTPDDPPTLLIHGTDDAWVPLDQSMRMSEALDRAGVPIRLIVVNGARHGFECQLEEPVNRDLLPEILAFLESAWSGHTE